MEQSDKLFESVGNYTRYKIIEMLINKHKDKKLTNLNQMEDLADDICDILSLCGMKFYSELNDRFSVKGDDDETN